MLETLLQYEDSEITHTIYSENTTFSLSYSKELKNFQVKNIETGHIEHFPDVETTSVASAVSKNCASNYSADSN